MKIRYFADTDTALIEFSNESILETKEISENLYIDLDNKGNLVSMTIEHARESELNKIVDVQASTTQKELLPLMTHEKQRHLLNLIPNEYHPDASQELINIIEHSHINTDDEIKDFELLRETRNDKIISFDEYLNGVRV